MVVLFIIVALCAMAILVPKKYLKIYFGISAVVLASVYFFFTPPIEYDLYRHYELFDVLKHMSFKDFISGAESDNWLYQDYVDSAPVYVLYLFIISRFGVKELLPVITTFIVYILLFKRVNSVGKDVNAKRAVVLITFMTILIVLDYRSMSGIRNIFTYVVFAYVLYEDLVNKKHRILCFLIYILLCGFHMSCVLLLILRLLTIVSNRVLKSIIAFMIAVGYIFSAQIAQIISKLVNIPYITSLCEKIIIYRVERTEYNWNGAIALMLIIFTFILVYIRVSGKRWMDNKKYGQYSTFILYFVAFMIGSFSQYDILYRNLFLLSAAFIPYIIVYFDSILSTRNGKLRLVGKCDDVLVDMTLSLMFVFMLICTLGFFWWISYLPIDGFILG